MGGHRGAANPAGAALSRAARLIRRRAGPCRAGLGDQTRVQRTAGATRVVFLDARTVAVGGLAQIAKGRAGRSLKHAVAAFEKLPEARNIRRVVDVHARALALQLVVEL